MDWFAWSFWRSNLFLDMIIHIIDWLWGFTQYLLVISSCARFCYCDASLYILKHGIKRGYSAFIFHIYIQGSFQICYVKGAIRSLQIIFLKLSIVDFTDNISHDNIHAGKNPRSRFERCSSSSITVKMASGRAFEEVTVSILHEDGSRTKKYTEPVTLFLEYDPHGLSCKVRRGKRPLLSAGEGRDGAGWQVAHEWETEAFASRLFKSPPEFPPQNALDARLCETPRSQHRRLCRRRPRLDYKREKKNGGGKKGMCRLREKPVFCLVGFVWFCRKCGLEAEGGLVSPLQPPGDEETSTQRGGWVGCLGRVII